MKLATLCYVQHGQKTLMLHRIKKPQDIHQGKWNGLGGKLLPGETPEQCVIREVEEESGITLSNPELRGILTFPNFDGNEDWYVFLFTATTTQDTFVDSPEGALSWIPDESLFELNLWEGDRMFLRWLSEGRFFSAKFVYREGALLEHSVVFY